MKGERNFFWKLRVVILSLAVFAAAVLVTTVLTRDIDKKSTYHAIPVATVRITDKGFEPATITVKQGTRVVWTNATNGLHQVVANPYPGGGSLKNLKSQILNNAQTYEYSATAAGTFNYHDQLKPTTNGVVVVQKP